MDPTPQERALRGRIGAYVKWSRTEDRATATAPARKANLDRFERLVDPDGLLDPQERAIRAEYAKKAHFARMALLSAQVRRARRQVADMEAQLAEGLAEGPAA